MKILHAPSNIANQAWAAAQGLRSLGHEVEVWQYAPNPFGFPADRVINLEGRAERVVQTLSDALAADFDVFHFHFARSLVPAVGGLPMLWDLPVLRALGKKVFFTFHGTDVRLRSRHIEDDPWSYFRFADVTCDEELIAKRLAIIRTYADRLIVASPLNSVFVPDATYVPKLIELSTFPMIGPRRSTRPLILHVPSRRSTKGTDFVVDGLTALKGDGLDFEFRIAESIPHAELRTLFQDADLVVDNLLLGDAEVSSLEAMALGKPVVTRIRDEVRAAHPALPAVNADPKTFAKQITPLIQSAGRRRELGEQGRRYVEETHAAEKIAAHLEGMYKQDPRPVWSVFPEWAGASSERKLETYEERIRTLQVKVAETRDKLAVRNRELAAMQSLYERGPLRILGALQRRAFQRR